MDALRFVLAAAVAFGHAWALLVEDYRATGNPAVNTLYFAAGFAHASVILFFVLSGYWITRSVAGRVRSGWSWRGYLVDRLSRLMVVLVPALALGGMLDAVALYLIGSPTHLGETNTFVLNTDVGANLAPENLLGNLVFLQEIFVRPYGSNGPLWSLAYEFWYYIWFPALLLSWRLRRPSLALVALLLAVQAPALAFGFLSWLCGSLLYFTEARLTRSSLVARLRGKLPLATTGLAFGAVLLWGRTGSFSIEDPLLALSFSLVLLTLLLTNPPLVPGIQRCAAYGAGASFSLYAIHFPLMAFAAALLIGGQRMAPGVAAISLVALTLAASIAIAWLFARATEARTATLRRTFRRLLRRAR
ncbi:acyltransferase family protein [Sphingomonas canadensis]|uniref:Acyltransferase family protein n=1 Tax=Sphingomonas canadensis TaxID=1219257 RepID=A0ABW3H7N4_9SPHN|nr:acyltransferase [Sphingomonas canadensis]MCW3837267.1 acyltransferase [Sphingomonas canadensis]